MSTHKTLRIASLQLKHIWFNSGEMSREVTAYLDYLESVVRDLHYQSGLVARAAGGDVPDIKPWKPSKEVKQ